METWPVIVNCNERCKALIGYLVELTLHVQRWLKACHCSSLTAYKEENGGRKEKDIPKACIWGNSRVHDDISGYVSRDFQLRSGGNGSHSEFQSISAQGKA